MAKGEGVTGPVYSLGVGCGFVIGCILIVSGLMAISTGSLSGAVTTGLGVATIFGLIGWIRRDGAAHSSDALVQHEVESLRALHQSVGTLAGRHVFQSLDTLTAEVLAQIDDRLEFQRPDFLTDPIKAAIATVVDTSGIKPLPAFDATPLLQSADARNNFRLHLYALQDVYAAGNAGVSDLVDYLATCIGEICERLPQGSTIVPNPQPGDLTISLLESIEAPKQLAEFLSFQPFEYETPTLSYERDRCLRLFSRISGKSIDDLTDNPHKLPRPTNMKGEPSALLKQFLAGSPFFNLLQGRIGFSLPADARFEHMHILAGTGHGKTQVIQKFVTDDLAHIERAAADEELAPRSVVIIDGQGDMINTVARRAICAPDGPLAGRVILIDPTDVAHPLALNMFDIGQDKLDQVGLVEREIILNGTIELYIYLFGALLGAELTQKQEVLFRFVARLMLIIPNATLDTLRDVLENGERYTSHIDQLDYASREFFSTQFFDKEFDDTKKQILRRLWGVLSNATLSAMFNSPVNKVDLGAELQRGTVVLINTAKDYLKTDGSRLFGRFWIAMIAQAALRRAAIPAKARIDTHVYIDEAHEYIDDKVEEILNQARKYRVGLTLAHQNRAQLSVQQRATIASSTAIKLVGGASEQDASGYAGDLRSDAATIMGTKKRSGGSEFVTFVRNHMQYGATVNTPFGVLERQPTQSSDDFNRLRDQIRARYGAGDAVVKTETPAARPASANDPGTPATEKSGFTLGDAEEL